MSNVSEFRKDMRAFLEKQRDFLHEQITFSESKNTVLIAFNGAVLVGAFTIFTSEKNVWWYQWLLFPYTILATLSCLVSLFFSLSAMFPKISQNTVIVPSVQTNNSPVYWLAIAQRKNGQEYLLYTVEYLFGVDGYKQDSAECLSELQHSSSEKLEGNWVYEMALSNQIVDLARLIARKYRLANIALTCMLFGFLTPLALLFRKSVALSIDQYPHRNNNFSKFNTIKSLPRL